MLLTMVNFDKQYMFGASLNLPFQIKDWWTLTANLTYLANGERREQKGSLTYHNLLNWYASSGFQLPKDFYFEISYYGQNKITMGEITVTPTHNLNASLKSRLQSDAGQPRWAWTTFSAAAWISRSTPPRATTRKANSATLCRSHARSPTISASAKRSRRAAWTATTMLPACRSKAEWENNTIFAT